MTNLFENNRQAFSVEVFPPKKDTEQEKLKQSILEISTFSPDYISVTYGAGGKNGHKTVEVADFVKNKAHRNAVCHLTCVGFTKEKIKEILKELKEKGIQNVLALRGDMPQASGEFPIANDFLHASELVSFIKAQDPGFYVTAACYPETHIEAKDSESDIFYLKEKVLAGTDHLVSQMFFDNEKFFAFLEKLQKAGINCPVQAGIMPITNAKQVKRMSELSGASFPKEIERYAEKFYDKPQEMRKAGIDFAIKQIDNLLQNSVNGIHLYSMNNPQTVREIYSQIGSAFLV